MTYPPPPGSGHAGAGGQQPGDPHELPTQLDPLAGQGARPPGQSPVSPATPPPPGYPPPGQPPPPGYGAAPGYGPPAGYGAAPGYPPGQPPGYPPGPQPGYGYPPQRPSGGKTGLIVGGIAGGVVLLLLLAVGAVVVVRAASSDAPDPPALPALPTLEPVEPVESEPPQPPDPGPAPGGGGSYGYVEDLCAVLDLSPVFDIVPPEIDDPDEWSLGLDGGSSSFHFCTIDLADSSATGSLSIRVNTTVDSDRAREEYENSLGGLVITPERSEDSDGPWEQGTMELGDTFSDASAALHAHDGNLAVTVSAYLYRASSDEELADAVYEIALNVVEVSGQ